MNLYALSADYTSCVKTFFLTNLKNLGDDLCYHPQFHIWLDDLTREGCQGIRETSGNFRKMLAALEEAKKSGLCQRPCKSFEDKYRIKSGEYLTKLNKVFKTYFW